LFVVGGVKVEVRATSHEAGAPVPIRVRAVIERAINPHGVERSEGCILVVPVSAERVVTAFADVAGQDAFGEVCWIKGHDAEGTALGDRFAFCSSGSDGQRGGEGEQYHAEEGGAELHCGWLRAIYIDKVSMSICIDMWRRRERTTMGLPIALIEGFCAFLGEASGNMDEIAIQLCCPEDRSTWMEGNRRAFYTLSHPIPSHLVEKRASKHLETVYYLPSAPLALQWANHLTWIPT
jgi:hypothetical protein